MKKIFTREILIGLILVVSLSILFVGIGFLKGINVFKSSNLYYVAFKDVSGLAEAAPVTLNGMKVGQVTGMEYDYEHPGNVLVEVNLMLIKLQTLLKMKKLANMEINSSSFMFQAIVLAVLKLKKDSKYYLMDGTANILQKMLVKNLLCIQFSLMK